jgi:manganese oxidase
MNKGVSPVMAKKPQSFVEAHTVTREIVETEATRQETTGKRLLSDQQAYAVDSKSSGRILHLAAALSLGAALIHVWVIPEHLREWWAYGALFLLVALAQGLFGVALLRWPQRSLFLAGIAGNLSIVSLYIVTRTAGVPFIGPHAWHPEEVGSLDLAATTLELLLVVALVALARGFSVARVYVILGALQAFGVGLVLHLLNNPGMHEAHGINPISHWLTSSAVGTPLSVLVVWLVTPLARRVAAYCYGEGAENINSRVSWALAVSAAYAAASVPAIGGLTSQHSGTGSFVTQAVLHYTSVVLGASFLILLAAAVLRGAPWEAPRAVNFWRPRAATALAGTFIAVAVVAGPAAFGGVSLLGQDLRSSAQAQNTSAACDAATFNRTYNVAATSVMIPYNRFAQLETGPVTVARNINEHGQAFVLQGDKSAVKNWHVRLGATPAEDPAGAQNRRLRPRPLVIRANAGECVKINFTNELDPEGHDGLPANPRASMRVSGVPYAAKTSDGSMVGFNPDTTVGIGESITYFWQAPKEEGTYFFRDEATTATSEANSGSISHGLYGAFAVEPAGSEWRDPETGQPLYDGATEHNRITKSSGDPYIDADIIPPGGQTFRETVQISQDEIPHGIGMGFNYGSEPQHNREAQNIPDGIGEEVSLSSWAYGDPALIKLASGIPTPEEGGWLPKDDPDNPGSKISPEDCGLQDQSVGAPDPDAKGSCYVSNVTHTYRGDPSKVRFLHAGTKETHVFHMHAHQWLSQPAESSTNPKSNIIDSQTFGPGESYTANLIDGSGSTRGTIGDSIFHCHLYPHFADGFWGLFRTHDVRESGKAVAGVPGSGQTPDGVNVRNLEPLPNNQAVSDPTADNPGYPRFMPGKPGWRAPQAPNSITEGGPTGPLAPRIVAGQQVQQTDEFGYTPLERGVQKLNYTRGNNDPEAPKPGAAFSDPCPTGAREVTYNASVIQTDVTYNEAGWHDKQARIVVPDKDVDAVLNGTKAPEPIFFRVNAGDCINWNLTNRLPHWFGGDAFVQLQQTNMFGSHIHLVKFDVTSSDGASNGWNYQQAAFSKEQADFNQQVLNGTQPCNPEPGGCKIQSRPADLDVNRGTTPETTGQTIHERWYADTELRTVFTHDHHFPAVDQNRGLFGALIVEPQGMDSRNPKTGEFYQPINNPANGPVCGSACEGSAVGTAMDIIGPGANDDFREFGLAIQDFVSLHKAGPDGEPISPPAAPEHFPNDDPGVMGINYRNAPFQLRETKNGTPVDPAYTFSSWVFGDPKTPLLEAYSNDPVRMRLIQGSQEEQHVFGVQGMRWREEPNNPNSSLVNSEAIGISEAFNFQAPATNCSATSSTECFADLLYGGNATDDLYLGAWGLMRVRGERGSLLPLPDNPVQNLLANDPLPSPTGKPPPSSTLTGNPCPTGSPTRDYKVVAMEADIKYNKYGDHDPFGLIYALSQGSETPDQTVARVRAQGKHEPLVLRANEGDCISVTLTNKLTQNWLTQHGNAGTNGDPHLPTEPPTGTRAGLRVSLHPQLVTYDPRFSNGAAVGFGLDQTVAPGGSRVYKWYADDVSPGEMGATNLLDFGDVRGHRHHGLFAGLNIEPKGSTYHDPMTGAQITSGASADIHVPGLANDFREFTTFFQDGLNLRDSNGATIEDPLDHPPTPEEPLGSALDAEDQGEKGFNYGSEPFRNRIGIEPQTGADLAHVFSSTLHGDPATPIFRAYAGDAIRMRLLQGSDKPRQNSFQLNGSNWKAQPNDPLSSLIGTQGAFSVGRTENIHLNDGTGGVGALSEGDYRYGSGVLFHHLSAGLWGILRVYKSTTSTSPTPIGALDNPSTGGHPIMPLERSATQSVPAAPTIPTATAGNASATVTWTHPDNGGSAITEYRVKVTNANNNTTVKTVSGISGNATSTVISNLTNGTAYKFQVRAVNAVGVGPFSAFSSTVTPRAGGGTTPGGGPVTLPGAPAIGTAVNGVTTDGTTISATAKWSPPTNNGGSAITQYRVKAIRVTQAGAVHTNQPNNPFQTAAASATQLKVTGLVQGAFYKFEVQASNTPSGQTRVWGPASTQSNQVTAR